MRMWAVIFLKLKDFSTSQAIVYLQEIDVSTNN